MRLIDADALMADIEKTIEDSGCVNHEGEILDYVAYAPTINDRVDDERFKAALKKIIQQPLTLAIRSVQAERKRQDEKWGDQNGNHPFEWVSILGEEYGELCEAVNETFFKNGDKPERGGIDKMRKEAVQVAAVAVALIEALDKSDHGNIHDNPELVKEGNE